MYQLKVLHPGAIPRALERVERYRLLNEPWEAESICRDILRTDAENQKALVMLLLALTDQFGGHSGVGINQALELLPRLADQYERVYYEGVIDERWAKAGLHDRLPGGVVYDWFIAAMSCYEKAEKLSPAGNEDAVLRWNACIRLIEKHADSMPDFGDEMDAGFTDSMPPR